MNVFKIKIEMNCSYCNLWLTMLCLIFQIDCSDTEHSEQYCLFSNAVYLRSYMLLSSNSFIALFLGDLVDGGLYLPSILICWIRVFSLCLLLIFFVFIASEVIILTHLVFIFLFFNVSIIPNLVSGLHQLTSYGMLQFCARNIYL